MRLILLYRPDVRSWMTWPFICNLDEHNSSNHNSNHVYNKPFVCVIIMELWFNVQELGGLYRFLGQQQHWPVFKIMKIVSFVVQRKPQPERGHWYINVCDLEQGLTATATAFAVISVLANALLMPTITSTTTESESANNRKVKKVAVINSVSAMLIIKYAPLVWMSVKLCETLEKKRFLRSLNQQVHELSHSLFSII